MQRILSFIFILFLANSAQAETFATNNVDAEFDVCMDAWKTGNVMWISGANETRVFVHKNDRIFDVRFLDGKGVYECREKMFYIKELPKETEQPKSSAVKEEPLEFDGFKFYCVKDSVLSFIQVLCEGKPSDETILSVQQVLSDGRLVRIKGQTLYGSDSGYLVQGFFLPAREAGFPASLLINSELNRISCRAMKAEQENVQALARLKRGQTYTITGNVDIVARTGLDLVNCRFELE